MDGCVEESHRGARGARKEDDVEWDVTAALRHLRAAARVPVAPHVAATLGRHARGDADALRELARALTPRQLAGGAALPDPLPAVSTTTVPDGLSFAERRLLLLAAMSVSQSPADVVEAAAVDVGLLLFGPLSELLVVGDGRLRFADERIRARVVHDAGPAAQRDAHAALARVSRRRGSASAALWHAACGAAPPARAASAPQLIGLAERRLAQGDVRAAERIAAFAADNAIGQARSRAAAVAGCTALWGGYLHDAEDRLVAVRDAPADLAGRVRIALDATRRLRHGPDSSARSRVRTADVLRSMSSLAAGPADRTALELLVRVSDALPVDPQEADALQAQLYLTTARTAGGAGDASPTHGLTPMTEAHVLMMQVAFQTRGGDVAGAGATLLDGIRRLPLVHPAAGAVAGYVRALSREVPELDDELARGFEAIAPRAGIRHELRGPALGRRATAAAAWIRSARCGEAGPPAPLEPLSPRQREVLDRLARGRSNRQIAEDIGLSARTVEVHLGQIYRKYEVRSRTEMLSVLAGNAERRASPQIDGATDDRAHGVHRGAAS